MNFVEEGPGGECRLDFADAIEEGGLVEVAEGGCFVEGGDAGGAERGEGEIEMVSAIAEVGAETEVCGDQKSEFWGPAAGGAVLK